MTSKKLFISHAAEDAGVAEVLRAWAHDIFANRCEVFVSTTYESLLLGKEWFPQIKSALRDSELLFCLVGPRSKNRAWLHFESGAAWLNDIPVVPVVHSGLEMKDLAAPLNQLQGLSLHDRRFAEGFFRRIADTLQLGPVPKSIKWDALRSELTRALDAVRGPQEVVSLWNDALYKGDVTLAETLTSATARDDIKAMWGSLETLSKKYQSGVVFKTIHEEEKIQGDAALVAYYTFYQDKRRSLKLFRDLVLLENGEWKIAPQFVYWEDLTPTRAVAKRTVRPTKRSTQTREKAPRR